MGVTSGTLYGVAMPVRRAAVRVGAGLSRSRAGRIAMVRRRGMVAQVVTVTVEGTGMSVVCGECTMPGVDINAMSVPRRVTVSFVVSTQDAKGGHEYKSDKAKSKEYCVGFHRSTLRWRRSSI